MDRRGFLRPVGASGAATIASGGSRSCGADPTPSTQRLDLTAANRKLAEYRIKHIETRPFRDRFPRSIGPNSKGLLGSERR